MDVIFKVFQELEEAINSRNYISLQLAVDNAIAIQIPPSAPKYQQALRLLQVLQQEFHEQQALLTRRNSKFVRFTDQIREKLPKAHPKSLKNRVEQSFYNKIAIFFCVECVSDASCVSRFVVFLFSTINLCLFV